MNQRLGIRLLVASLAAFLLSGLFAGLLALVDTQWQPLEDLDEDTTKTLNEYVLDHRVWVRPLQATSYIFHAWVFRFIVAVLVVWLFYRGARRLVPLGARDDRRGRLGRHSPVAIAAAEGRMAGRRLGSSGHRHTGLGFLPDRLGVHFVSDVLA